MEFVHRRSVLIAAVLILGASVIGMLAVVYATREGPGVGSDSTIYLVSAQNLLAGNGLGWMEPGGFHRLDYYPPFYPLAVALPGLILGDIVAAARWLNVLLFGGLIAVLGTWSYRSTRNPILAGLLSGTLAVSPVLVGVTAWAMSEPVFLLTGFSGLALLAAYLDRPRLVTLLVAALLTGLAFLSRYLGVVFVMTGGLFLLLLPAAGKGTFRQRLCRSLIFGFVAVLPMVVWLALDLIASGTVGGRSGMPSEAFLPRFLGTFTALEPIVLFWLLPESVASRLPGAARFLLVLLPLAALVVLSLVIRREAARRKTDKSAGYNAGVRLALMMGLFSGIYLLVLAVLQAVVYPPVAVDLRMLSPVHVGVIVLVFALAYLALGAFAPARRWIGYAVLLAGVVFSGSYALRGFSVAQEYRFAGIGYSTKAWRQSDVVKAVRELPESIPLITNDKAALMFLAGRATYEVAEIYRDKPEPVFTRYGSGMDEAQRVFREQSGALVLFNASLEDDFAIYGDRTAERISALVDGLYLYYEGEDGSIYYYREVDVNTQ
jgi:hypothetical protein